MASKFKSNYSIDDLYKIIVEEPENGENSWQTKSIRLLALNNLIILQKLDKLDFKVMILLYLFTAMIILLFSAIIKSIAGI